MKSWAAIKRLREEKAMPRSAIITRDEAQQVVARNRSFFLRTEVVDGHTAEIYSYRLATPGDFINPTGARERTHRIRAHELRGITYVSKPSILKPGETIWQPWLALHKFFNYAQTDGYTYDELAGKPILGIYDKLDGSMIHFVKIDDRWYAKTKGTFYSEQANWATEYARQRPDFIGFLDYCYDNGMQPIFEYTSPENQVVLRYAHDALTLIQARCVYTGVYYDVETFQAECAGRQIPVVEYRGTEMTLDELVEYQQTAEGVEGLIVNHGGQLVKWKTDWYFRKYYEVASAPIAPRRIARMVLDDKIDDVIAALHDRPELQQRLTQAAETIRKVYYDRAAEVERLAAEAKTYPDPRSFYTVYRNHPYIVCAIKLSQGKDIHRHHLPFTFMQQWDKGTYRSIQEEPTWETR